jgi:hypothetical protein
VVEVGGRRPFPRYCQLKLGPHYLGVCDGVPCGVNKNAITFDEGLGR